MKRSEGQKAIGLAMVNALAKLTNPPKTKTVRTDKYTYAYTPLPEILDMVRPVLKEYGLAVLQSVGEGPSVTTMIVHESGEWIESEPCVMQPTANNPQGAGSAISYARRYSLSAMLGIMADDDDDGAQASFGGGKASSQPRQPANAAQGKGGGSGSKLPYRFKMDEQPVYKSGAHVFAKGPFSGQWGEMTWGDMARRHVDLMKDGLDSPDTSPIANMIASEFIKGWNREQAEKIDADANRKIDAGVAKPTEPEEPVEGNICPSCGVDWDTQGSCPCVPF